MPHLHLFAENVTITITAPKSVGPGETFPVSYEIGTQGVTDFEYPEGKGFQIVDTRRSSSSSTTIINGAVTTKSSTTITLFIKSPDSGNFTVGPAKVHIGNKIYTSKSVPITVVAGGSANASTSQGNTTTSQGSFQSSTVPKRDDSLNDIFVRAVLSKTKVYEQEAVLLSYRIYASTNLYVTGFQGKLPVLNGFLIQEVEPDRTQSSETINGRRYNTAVWKQYVLYPQSSGTNEIPSIDCEATISIERGFIDPFGMIPRTETRSKKMKSHPAKLDVMPLPSPAPSSFSGGVGDFSVDSKLNKHSFKTGDVLSVKVTVNGTGNLRLMNSPTAVFPDNFETYDTKTSDNYDITSMGHSGSKTFEFLAVPKKEGHYNISGVEFTYFDPQSGKYITKQTNAFSIDVEKGDDALLQTDVEELNHDIHHIKTGDVELNDSINQVLFSWRWLIAYLVVIIAFIPLFYYTRKYSRQSLENPFLKRKRAGKAAIRHLSVSKSLIQEGNSIDIYNNLLNALSSFIIDKLNIDKEQYTKDNIRNILIARGVDSDLINEYQLLVNDCEFARYTSSSTVKSAEECYSRTIEIINKLDSILK